MLARRARGDRHDDRCRPAGAGGTGGWGFPSATAAMLPGRYAAWSDPALRRVRSRWALVRQVLRAWPSRGAGGRQVVRHPRWPLYISAGGLRPTRQRGKRHLTRPEARKSARTQRHHRRDRPAARRPPSRQDPGHRYGHHVRGPRAWDVFDREAWSSSEDHRQLDLRLENLAREGGDLPLRSLRRLAGSVSDRSAYAPKSTAVRALSADVTTAEPVRSPDTSVFRVNRRTLRKDGRTVLARLAVGSPMWESRKPHRAGHVLVVRKATYPRAS
jgi:hypothetical protein